MYLKPLWQAITPLQKFGHNLRRPQRHDLDSSQAVAYGDQDIVSLSGQGTDYFPQAEQRVIQKTLDRCRYGLGWRWVNPRNKLAIHHQGGHLQFAGYYQTGVKNQTYKGDCQQLAHQVGKSLGRQFKGQYQFYVACGDFPNSPWSSHYFLIACPTAVSEQFLNRVRGSFCPLSKQFRQRIPFDAFLIDPTYNQMGFYQQHPQLSAYQLLNGRKLQNAAATHQWPHSIKVTFQNNQITTGLPLGFTSQVLPSHPASQNGNSLVFAHFTYQANRIPAISTELKVDDMPLDWRQLPVDSPAYKMARRLQKMAQKN